MHRTIANFHGGPFGMGLPAREELPRAEASQLFLSVTMASSRFTEVFIRSAANVAGAVVVIIGEHAADFAVLSTRAAQSS